MTDRPADLPARAIDSNNGDPEELMRVPTSSDFFLALLVGRFYIFLAFEPLAISLTEAGQ